MSAEFRGHPIREPLTLGFTVLYQLYIVQCTWRKIKILLAFLASENYTDAAALNFFTENWKILISKIDGLLFASLQLDQEVSLRDERYVVPVHQPDQIRVNS